MEGRYLEVAPPAMPELASLPKPRTRCPICGKSRTWLIEANEEARRDGMPFLFRVRQRGKMRGTVFLRVPVLLAWLAKREAEDCETVEGEKSDS